MSKTKICLLLVILIVCPGVVSQAIAESQVKKDFSLEEFRTKLKGIYPEFLPKDKNCLAAEIVNSQFASAFASFKMEIPRWGFVYFNGIVKRVRIDRSNSGKQIPNTLKELTDSILTAVEGFIQFYDMLVFRPMFRKFPKTAELDFRDSKFFLVWYEGEKRYRNSMVYDNELMVEKVISEDLLAQAKNELLPKWKKHDGKMVLTGFTSKVSLKGNLAYANRFVIENSKLEGKLFPVNVSIFSESEGTSPGRKMTDFKLIDRVIFKQEPGKK